VPAASLAATLAGVLATALPAHADPAGSLDPTFGTVGKVTTDFGANPSQPEIANDMLLQSDGKIVAIGRGGAPRSTPATGPS
jgi:hypothetical protein